MRATQRDITPDEWERLELQEVAWTFRGREYVGTAADTDKGGYIWVNCPDRRALPYRVHFTRLRIAKTAKRRSR